MTEKQKSKKYKETKQLIDIALEDGMTQNDIAKFCRTHQSRVSKWKNGEELAPLHIIKPLIQKYSYKVKTHRTTEYFQILQKYQIDNEVYYLHLNNNSDYASFMMGDFKDYFFFRWFEKMTMEQGLKIIKNSNDNGTFTLEHMTEENQPVKIGSISDQVKINNIDLVKKIFDLENKGSFIISKIGKDINQVVSVEGPVIFKYHFQKKETDSFKNRKTRFTWQRWFIHELEKDKLVWVIQFRRLINGNPVDTYYNDAKWHSLFFENLSAEIILRLTESYINCLSDEHTDDKAVLPLIMKKTLIENGYDFDDVIKIHS